MMIVAGSGYQKEDWHMRAISRARRGALIAAAATFLAATATTQASAAAVTPSIRPAMRYCFTEIAKIHPPQPASRVVVQTCSRQHAPGSLLPAGLSPRLAALTPLVTFYQNRAYTGLSDTVSGANGPCDISGYGFSDLRFVESDVLGISSYKLHNNCQISNYWYNTNFKGHGHGAVTGNVRYVGATWNDHLWSMRTWA
jgi:hypothetical protein